MVPINSDPYWPLGSTVQKTVPIPLTSDSFKYEHFGIISSNPTNGIIVVFYRKSLQHTPYGGSNIYLRKSYDGGVNWSNETQIITGSEGQNIDLKDAQGGYISNGRLFLFYAIYNCSSSLFISMNYIYSDNDGLSWSTPNILLTQTPTQTSTIDRYVPFGHIVDFGNNLLLQSWHGFNNQDFYGVYIYKSSNGGYSFDDIWIIYEGNDDLTEPTIVNIGGGCFLALIRINNSFVFRQFISTDNGQHWTSQGDTSFEELSGYQAPAFLSYINFEGIGIVACYFTNRGTHQLKVIYGIAERLIEIGPDAWGKYNDPSNLPVINIIRENFGVNTSYVNSGYQSFYHPNKQFNGIGLGFAENYDRTEASPEIFFTNNKGQNSSYVNVIDVLLNIKL
jgi:hypothetical protein